MPVWKLVAFSTEDPLHKDVRYRRYTTSKRTAERFARIPKIQFSDGGHGIVFAAIPSRGRRQPEIWTLADYVGEHMTRIMREEEGPR